MSFVEIWRPVVGFELSHEVSNCGQVRTIDRSFIAVNGKLCRYQSKLLKTQKHVDGYSLVSLRFSGKKVSREVHSLVMEAFVGPRPPGLEVCHNDSNPANNILSNLRYDTRSANSLDSVSNSTHSQSSKLFCKHGHELFNDNICQSLLKQKGHRRCMSCKTAHGRLSYARRVGKHLDFKATADLIYESLCNSRSV